MNTQTPTERRGGKFVAIVLGALLAIPMYGAGAAPAVAATEDNPSFYLNANDLDFILRQIQISEAHAAGADLLCSSPTDRSGKCVPSPKLPFGLRTVDGSFNNLVEGRSHWGAADQPFPSILAPHYRQADPALTAPGAPPAGNTDMCAPGLTCYSQWEPGHIVYDSSPRMISNLIVDQSTNNPAAVNAAKHLPGSEVRPDGSVHLPNMAPDEGLSAPTNAFFTFFGQFFDHGLDLVDKGGNGTLVVPLSADDPLRMHPDFNTEAPYLVLTRATRQPGPDGIIGTDDDTKNNETTPFVDQNQTYTSHPAHQVFLREYEMVDGVPADTGKLLNSPEGGLATWTDIRNQARDLLGIELTDKRALDVPQVVVDPYGNFVAGPNGFPLLITDNDGNPMNVEGNPSDPVNADDALTTGHAFLEDIAHGATPVVVDGDLSPRFDENGDPVLDDSGEPVLSGYDNVSLGAHFVTGDGRGNENIGLTTVHAVFHAEHNRMVGSIETTLAEHPELEKAFQGLEHNWPNKRSAEVLPGPESDDWSYEQRLFQAARFATEMEYQHLVFEEFARTVQPSIDAVVFNENTYNANIDPAITAEFAHVVYRFGHSMLTNEIERDGFNTEDVPLLDGFLNPAAYNDHGRLGADEAAAAIVNGTVRQQSSQIDEFVVDTLRNNLLGLPLDLPTINLLRGRDAGVPPLQEARRTFFNATGDPTLRPYSNWVDFGNELKNGNIFGRDATNSSLVNFVAAYGTHETVVTASTIEEKRAAASLLVNGTPLGDEAFISRHAGATSDHTAALISSSEFEAPAPVVYLTTNLSFPDALAAGPLATADEGPLLLTGTNIIPFRTLVEIDRLKPERVVILGGDGAVSQAVTDQIQEVLGIAPTRIGGADRFSTAVEVSKKLIPTTGAADTVYMATGMDFPDSLTASAVAARDGDPILLTRPDQLPTVVRNELVRLSPNKIVITGGTGAITEATVQQIRATLPGATIERIGGADRFSTAVEISKYAFDTGHGGTLYVTTGMNFPDGLTVGPVAGLNDRPVLLIPNASAAGVTNIPQVVLDEIERLAPEKIVILGGTGAVSADVDVQLSEYAPTLPEAPEDRVDFMFSTGTYADENSETVTGLEDVDFWTGGLAERVNPFGGLLGSSFNYVFEEQLEALQFGDRFYYLFRNQGNQLFAALEANSFSSIIERNTQAANLPANIFFVQEPVIELANMQQPYPGTLRRDPDQTWRWVGDEHVEIHGTSGDDRIKGDEGDDSISGKAGDDFIAGGAGNDTLVGGDGNDVITDTFGDDVLKGGWGNDALHSGPGFDIVHGGPGHDFLMNGGDTDNMFAGDGNDIMLGSTGRIVAAFAGEGNDWVEGSRHADLLQGDNGDQFQADVIGGDDVVIGRGGDDDIEGEGGDDILVGEWFGTDRHLGNMGFDWITYYGEDANVNVDFLVTVLQRPDVTAVRDRYDQLEAMSGGTGNDQLRGIGRELDGSEGADPELHKMTESTIDLVDGLREMLQPKGHDNYALRFMNDGPVVDTDGVNNLIVAGPGSDVIEGRGGDDFIDGDMMLKVQLGWENPDGEVEYQNSAEGFSDRVFAGEIDPGDLFIVRELVDASEEGDIDTAEFIGNFSEYEIEDLGDGYFRIHHANPAADEAEEAEGADIIRNIELLQFADACYDLVAGELCEGIAQIQLSTESPFEDQEVTAEILDMDGQPFDMSNASSLVVEWWAGEGQPPTESELVASGSSLTYVPGDEAIDQVLQARFKFTMGGITHVVTSAWTANPVENINDAPQIPELTTPGGVLVGENVQVRPPTDGDGVEGASEAGWTYTFESAANAEFTDDVQELRTAASTSYTLTENELNRFIRVTVEYADDFGAEEVVSTPVIGPVGAAL